jgi:hypothetical protein
VPRFNRESRVIAVLQSGRAVLLFKSWDTPGVLAAGRAFADALEQPAGTRWDSPYETEPHAADVHIPIQSDRQIDL